MRVPVPDGSATDLIAQLGRETTRDEVNEAFKAAAASGPLAPVLDYSEEPLVSGDIVGQHWSSIFDSKLTMDAVWHAIGSLSVDLKMALLLRDLVGLSYAEIAEALDTTLATVKWRIYKARETVVAELLREGYDFGHRPAATPPVAVGDPS